MTDNLFEFGAVTERDVGMYSSSEVLGVSGVWSTLSSLDDEEAALEMDKAGECSRLRDTALVAGLRVNETVESFRRRRGGQGKSKDFPSMDSLISPPEMELWGGWGAGRGGEEKRDRSNEGSKRKDCLPCPHDSSSSGS